MEQGRAESVLRLDWDTQALWVQDRTMYLLAEGEDPQAPMLNVQDQLGKSSTVERSKLEQTHVPVHNATIYKSKYAPIRPSARGKTLLWNLKTGR